MTRRTLSGQNGLAETMYAIQRKLRKDYAPASKEVKKSLAESMSLASKLLRSHKC